MERVSIMNRKRRISDDILTAVIYLSAFIAVAILVGIIGYVFFRGISQVNWSFLTNVQSASKGTVGIAGNIVNTLYIVILTLLVVTPIGIGGAIYLSEYAKPGKFVSLIEFTIETLTGIPSIIFGLFGSVFFGEVLKLKYSMLTGALTNHGAAAHRKEYPGGLKDRAGQLPQRCPRHRRDEMVHDPDDHPAERHAGNLNRRDFGHRPHRRRVGSPLIYGRQRIRPAEGRHGTRAEAF